MSHVTRQRQTRRIISHLSNATADVAVNFLPFLHGCKMVPELCGVCVQGRKEAGKQHRPRLLLCRDGRSSPRRHHKLSLTKVLGSKGVTWACCLGKDWEDKKLDCSSHWVSNYVSTIEPINLRLGLESRCQDSGLAKPTVFQLRSQTWFQDLRKLRFLMSHRRKNCMID